MLRFRPVDTETVADFRALFEAPGGPKACWCMVWRATPEEGRGTTGAIRKPQMLSRIEKGIPVGLIGYTDEGPRAWVSIAPRDTYRRLGGPEAEPGENIWSLACMFAHRSLRGQGITHELISAAVDHARKNGATVIEAYPVAPNAPSYRFMGRVPSFEKEGFTFVEKAGKRRNVMRKPIR